jgi:carbonic anhydrase
MNSLPGVFRIGRRLPAVAALLVFICVPYAAMAQEHPAHEWGYSGSEGPAHWGELDPKFAACKTGHLQSPVAATDYLLFSFGKGRWSPPDT